MMQGNHRHDAAFLQSAQHVAIFFDGILIPCIRCWLDATPLNRKTMRILSGLGGAVEVFAPASAPPVGGDKRRSVGVTFLFPLPPIVIRVVAFPLMCGGCCSPQKSFWKMIG